jgi:UDP-glucose 4-epimerase
MTQETWLLTGGAGYIGTHIADEFIRNGKKVVIYDSLYQGLESRIVYLRAKHNVEIPLIKADIRDYNEIENVIRTHKIDGIVHTAALKQLVNPWKNQMSILK